jgi:Chitobiase/beta-hexosaminidase C-terminal domain/Abnormal spindle-like microcephaly-assoc'd, ASPM-SPD-2-Hydin
MRSRSSMRSIQMHSALLRRLPKILFLLSIVLVSRASAQQFSLSVTWTVTPIPQGDSGYWSGTDTLTIMNGQYTYTGALVNPFGGCTTNRTETGSGTFTTPQPSTPGSPWSFTVSVPLTWENVQGSGCANPGHVDGSGSYNTPNVVIQATPTQGVYSLSTDTTYPPGADYGNSQTTITASGFLQPSGIVALSASSLSFSPQPLNTTSHRQKISLNNTGSAPVTISDISPAPGGPTGGFSLGAATNCQISGQVAAGGACDLYVVFTPTATGPMTGTLSITTSASSTPLTAALSGTNGCTSNAVLQTFGQYDYSPVFSPPSAEWIPQEDYPTASGSAVPQYFGYLPSPNPTPAGQSYVLLPTIKSGCALTSTATLLSSFGLNVTPLALDTSLKSTPNYGQGTINMCSVVAPSCSQSQRVPYSDQGEFLWNSPAIVFPSVQYLGSQEVTTALQGELITWDSDKASEGENGDVFLNQYLADYVCADSDQFATPPPGRTLSPPAGVILQLEHTTSTGQHFVVVNGRTSNDSDWALFDPGWSSALDTLQGHLNGFQEGSVLEQFTVAGTRTYQGTGGSSSLSGNANSPVELLVTDPMGRQLGNMNGNDTFGIPYGSYTRDFPYNDDDSGGLANGDPTVIKGFSVPLPPDGTYQVVATGTGSGPYTLTFVGVASDGSAQTQVATGTTTLGLATSYELTYSSTPGSPFTVALAAPAATPTISLPSGKYTSAQDVMISDSTPGASIYYTINGSTPTTASTLYSGAISVSTTTTIQAIAVASGYATSAVASATYTISLPVLSTPAVTVTPSPSSITTAQALSVTVTVGGTPTPTGSVTLGGGGYTSIATTLTNGSATISVPAGSLATGSDILTASYTPDAVSSTLYTMASGSAPVTVTTASYSMSATAVTMSPGTPGTSTVTISSTSGYAGAVSLACSVTSSPSGASDLPTCTATQTVTLSATTTSGTASVIVTSTAASSALIWPKLRQGSTWTAGGSAVLALILLPWIPKRQRSWFKTFNMVLGLALAGGLTACGGGGSSGSSSSSHGTTAGSYTITLTGTGNDSAKTSASTTFMLTVN